LAEGAEDGALLAPFGHKALVTHDRKRTYRISREMLPTDWQPRQGVFGVGLAEPADQSAALSGYVSVGDEVFPLEDWYTEVRFALPEDGGGVELSVDTLGARRELALAWWAEA
jgi:hypothetical protein